MRKGRRSFSQWQAIINESQAGPHSVKQYLEKHKINSKSYYKLRKIIADRKLKPKSDAQPQFIELQSPGLQPTFTITTPQGLRIETAMSTETKDGRLLIDKNLAENAIRPIALGRKNWLFVGNPDGGHAAATLMTFTETCRKLKINPWRYLKDVLTRIQDYPISKIQSLISNRLSFKMDCSDAYVSYF